MKWTRLIVAATSCLFPLTAASTDGAETYKYESDIARLRSLVIHSLYSHKDVFLRELVSNANDALEKLRITALTDRNVMNAGEANVTMEVNLYEGGATGQLIIRDTGIGMSKEELARNLGTIARSGTSEFLKKAEEQGGGGGGPDGNLIGQFGLGFYSCFLVSDSVRVSSLPPATASDPNPIQHTFISSSSGDSFEIFPDPRGNTLGRGTEIILEIQEDAKEWLSPTQLQILIEKHSQFSTTFPIYLKENKHYRQLKNKPESDDDEEEESEPTDDDYEMVHEEHWIHVNDKAPIWMREPKEVLEKEYGEFYKAVAKEPAGETLGWSHFKGDTGAGVSFRSIMYIPAQLPRDFWQTVANGVKNVRLMVKRVFITDELGDEYMPRWLSFLKVVVDADDLPLNVSRETLQNTRFLQQLQRILVKKAIDLFQKIASDEPEKFKEVSKLYGNPLRIGIMESERDRIKLAKLLRFESTRSKFTSLDEYVDNRKEGQKQIYYVAGVGDKTETLARSPFVEKLIARGYEVLLLNLPSDEPMMTALQSFKGMTLQDVSKKGLQYGDESDDEAEKQELGALKIAFSPLIDWLKKGLSGQISDVVLTNRLVSSSCTIVVDSFGWSANMARIMSAQVEAENDPMFQMMKDLPRVLEINPKSPLIQGLLERVLDLPENEDDTSVEEEELRDVLRVLFDTTLVRSGFTVPDTTSYFDRVDALLRRSLGVSLSAKGQARVKPAPPTAMGPLHEDGITGMGEDTSFVNQAGGLGDDAEWVDWKAMKAQMEQGIEHDEL